MKQGLVGTMFVQPSSSCALYYAHPIELCDLTKHQNLTWDYCYWHLMWL